MSDSPFEEFEFSSAELSELEELIGVCAESVSERSDISFLGYRENGTGEVDYRIGNNVVKGLLGVGGQSMCLLAEDEILQRDVVLKLYRDGLKPIRKEQIVREGRALAKIDSPHIAKCYSTGDFDGRPYLALEYVKGKPLDQWAQEKQVDSEFALGLVCQLAKGVQAIHGKNLLHLDLKPENIVIDENDRPIMIDFGLSVSCFESVGERVEGTASYIAPERLLPELVDQRADVFGIGAVLFYLLCGKPPRNIGPEIVSAREAAAQPIDLDLLESSNGSTFAKEVCRRCLELDPENRFQSADELVSFLESRPRSRLIKPAIFTVAAAAILLVFIWQFFFQSQGDSNHALRNDFEVTYQIEDASGVSDWRQFVGGELPESKSFEMDGAYELKIKVGKPSYVSVFSLEYSDSTSKIDSAERVFTSFTELVPAGTIYRETIEPANVTPGGNVEFLWVMATSMPVDANSIGDRLTAILRSRSTLLDSGSGTALKVVKAEMAKAVAQMEMEAGYVDLRGIKVEPKLLQITEGVIPYRVVE